MYGEPGSTPFDRCPITVFMRAHRLSPRETRVVDGALRELSNAAIAKELGCSPSTIRTYWARIFQKLGCSRENHVLARIARFAAAWPLRERRLRLRRCAGKRTSPAGDWTRGARLRRRVRPYEPLPAVLGNG